MDILRSITLREMDYWVNGRSKDLWWQSEYNAVGFLSLLKGLGLWLGSDDDAISVKFRMDSGGDVDELPFTDWISVGFRWMNWYINKCFEYRMGIPDNDDAATSDGGGVLGDQRKLEHKNSN